MALDQTRIGEEGHVCLDRALGGGSRVRPGRGLSAVSWAGCVSSISGVCRMFLFGSLAAIVVVGFSVAGAPLQAQAGIDRAALDALVDAARAANSDALVVLRDGEVVFESSFGQPIAPIESMSVTKSVVNLALGHLYTEGKITSLDQPVHHYFPEWKQGRKQDITLRHVLSHTSGLQNVRHTGVEIYPSPDFVRLALAAELSDAPGERFAYDNKALTHRSEI